MERLFTLISVGKKYTYDVAPSSRYPDKFGQQLTDGQVIPDTGAHYVDARAMGFNGTVNITIDLEDDGKNISALAARCLSLNQDGVGPAEKVIFAGSDNGIDFEELGVMEFVPGMDKTIITNRLTLPENRDFRYIRYTMNPKNGYHFFFVDELQVFADVEKKAKAETVTKAYSKENINHKEWKKLSTGKESKHFTTENAAVGMEYTFEGCIFDERAPENHVLLTDGGHVGGVFGEDVWVGFKGEPGEVPSVVIDLGRVREDIFAFKLHAPDEVLDIVHPDYIDCFGSDDGQEYVFIGRMYAPANNLRFAYSLLLPEYIKARFIKFEFSSNEGYYWFEEIEVISGSDVEIQAELFPKVYYPKVTEELVWDKNDSDYSETKNLILGLPQQIAASFYIDKYARGGNETPAETTVLTDGKKAETAEDCFYNHGGESLEFFYDIGKASSIESFTVGCYENNEKSLPRPDHIHIQLSDDATNWYTVAQFDRPWHKVEQIKKTKEFVFEGAERLEINFPLETAFKARFVKFRIELENGVLLDELSVYGKKDISEAVSLENSGIKSAPFYTNPADERFSTVNNTPIKANDIALIYHDHHTKSHAFLPFVAYLDEEGNIKDTFMDGYLFLPGGVLPSGTVAWGETRKADWEFICDNAFTAAYGMDNLEATVQQVKDALNKPDYKVQVYISIPHITDIIEDFGDVDGDGKIETLTTKEDRAKVLDWYIQLCLKTFKERNYKNLELGGFYWFNELVGWLKDDSHIIKEVADKVHEAGSYFLWIPYYVAHRYFLGYELGFDFVSMQPNYVFETKSPLYKLPSCARFTKQRSYTVEIEHSYQALSDPNFARKYMLYLYYGALTGYMDSIHAYYDDKENIGLMGYSKDPLCRMQYDATYKFAKHTLDITAKSKDTVKLDWKKNTILRSTLNPENGLSIFTLVKSPVNGSVSLSADGTFAYYPEKGFTGRDGFSYTYNNYLGESEECFVEIEVE